MGKKYTTQTIAKAMTAKGLNADFRATGQTGILISGSGVAVDAVVPDFIAGAAEALSPPNSPDHWDIAEGQGPLFRPAYSEVPLGLLHGSQPHALVLCHDPTRQSLNGFPHMPVISPEQALAPYLAPARLTNPKARFVEVSLNTSRMSEEEAQVILRNTAQSMCFPCVDPIRTGVESIAAALETVDAR